MQKPRDVVRKYGEIEIVSARFAAERAMSDDILNHRYCASAYFDFHRASDARCGQLQIRLAINPFGYKQLFMIDANIESTPQ
ncbi:hypothetical protein ELE36_02410 [Pseudolysobacter antarcticus]|uniref:Uncharacterized protein n=1 Tax=Pseudolysobacter antarcticus TaxID=2511995 RepID=A0A411HFQ2_9GAMM|nr:hypothetical protein [Pseudolysobacter antarcticus]QBB69318.1 hypothetical protein ELE36_02410 [Pseudolysobacter antarcticus]